MSAPRGDARMAYLMRFAKTSKKAFDVGWHGAPADDSRPELDRWRSNEPPCELDRGQIVMEVWPAAAM